MPSLRLSCQKELWHRTCDLLRLFLHGEMRGIGDDHGPVEARYGFHKAVAHIAQRLARVAVGLDESHRHRQRAFSEQGEKVWVTQTLAAQTAWI